MYRSWIVRRYVLAVSWDQYLQPQGFFSVFISIINCYKPEDRRFVCWWGHRIFPICLILPVASWSWNWFFNRNEFQDASGGIKGTYVFHSVGRIHFNWGSITNVWFQQNLQQAAITRTVPITYSFNATGSFWNCDTTANEIDSLEIGIHSSRVFGVKCSSLPSISWHLKSSAGPSLDLD